LWTKTTSQRGGRGNRGVPKSIEHKQKLSEAASRRGQHTDEHRAKIAAALRGRVKSAETKAKLGATNRGRIRSKAARQKYRHAAQKHAGLFLPECRCWVHQLPSWISSLTWKLAEVLVAAGYEVVIAEQQVGRFRVDVLLAEEWIAFEADGSYWHKDSAIYDAARDTELLQKFSLPVVRLTDVEVENLYGGAARCRPCRL